MDELIRMQEFKQQGFYCSQILLLLGLDAQGKANPDLIRAMHALAGGVGFTGDICGALTGGACLLGLYAGKGLPREEEDFQLRLMIEQLTDWFKAEYGQLYGGIRCDDLLENDPGNRATRCPAIVANVYQQVKELLVANGYNLAGSDE